MGTQKTCWKGAKCAGQTKDHRRKTIGAVGGKLADNRQQRVKNHKAQLVNILAVGTVSLTSCLWPGPSGAETGELNFDKYQGIWYEVASLKKGFAGEGQQDCHCTAGVYDKDEEGLTVKTFCVHGSSTGRISGIEGVVRGGTLRFPSIPFIPALPYNVLDTDYRSYALVEGAKDSSFVQIYSRKPNPGKDFIAKQKKRLATEGYDPDVIKNTPQDCSNSVMNKMDAMMKSPSMTSMFQNTAEKTVEELVEDFDGIALSGPRNPLNEAKNLFNLFQMFAP